MANPRVLLVDDEAELTAVMQKRLTRRGLVVDAVHSGKEALAFVAETPVDVVVLDVKMPGMDGIETLTALKAAHPLVEVVMLTGHADFDAAVKGLEKGAFDYLMKPMEIDELLYKLEDAGKKKALAQEKIEKAKEALVGG